MSEASWLAEHFDALFGGMIAIVLAGAGAITGLIKMVWTNKSRNDMLQSRFDSYEKRFDEALQKAERDHDEIKRDHRRDYDRLDAKIDRLDKKLDYIKEHIMRQAG